MTKKAIAVLAICVLGFVTNVNAQTAAKWYFGIMTGLDFSTSPPSLLRGGNTAGVGYNVEASTSVTDNSGNLLFVTAANRIYNGNLVVQPELLATTTDAAQGHLAVPRPGTTNQYYLFTVDATHCGTADLGSQRGARYRIVTTGAAGAITVGAETDVTGSVKVAECQVAVPHQNGTDYWWIIHERESSNFRVYLVTNGAVTLSSTYAVGPSFGTCTYTSVLKVNTCYDQLALSAAGEVSLFNFNYSTGAITLANTVTEAGAYGLEFSPNDDYLYVSTGTQGGDPQAVIRYTVGATLTGRTSMGATYGATGKSGHLQLGPDGVIYLAQMSSYSAANYNHYIGAITNPDGGGTFNNQYISLNDAGPNQQAITMGLPTILREFLVEAAPDIDDANLTISGGSLIFCPNTSYSFFYTFGGSASTVTWNFGDGTGDFSSLSPVNHTYTSTGTFTITLTVVDRCGRSKTTTRPAVVQNNTAAGSIICGTNQITLDGTGANAANYKWFTSASGGPLIASGDNVTLPYNPISTAPTSVWVQDFTTSTALGTLGPGSLANSEGANTITNIQTHKSNLFLESVNLMRYDPGCGCTSGTVTISLKQGATTLNSATFALGTSCGTTLTFNLGFTLPTSGTYSLEQTSTTTGACATASFRATLYGGFSPTSIAGYVTNNGASAGNSGPFYNMVFRIVPACAARTRIDQNCALPVGYLYIKGKATTLGNILEWATASELNNSHFLIQYASNGVDFTTIGEVNGHGTSNSVHTYSFLDETSRSGQAYYRLVQVDYDHSESLSEVIALYAGDVSQFVQVKPNPFHGQTTISFNGVETESIELLDVCGKTISTYTITEGQSELLIGAELPAGSYVVRGTGYYNQWNKLLVKE